MTGQTFRCTRDISLRNLQGGYFQVSKGSLVTILYELPQRDFWPYDVPYIGISEGGLTQLTHNVPLGTLECFDPVE